MSAYNSGQRSELAKAQWARWREKNKLRPLTKCKTPEYKVWRGMISRCTLSKATGYKNYGARGITVCDKWRHSFEAFLTDMGKRPNPKSTIERIDNNKGYSPENTIWSDRNAQANNTRANVFITFNGRTQTLVQWARETGLHRSVITHRLQNGWTVEKALFCPKLREPRGCFKKQLHDPVSGFMGGDPRKMV